MDSLNSKSDHHSCTAQFTLLSLPYRPCLVFFFKLSCKIIDFMLAFSYLYVILLLINLLPLYPPYQPPSLRLLVPQPLCCFHGIFSPFLSFHPLPPSFGLLLLLVRMCPTHTKINNWTMRESLVFQSQHPSSCTCHSLIFLYNQIKSQYLGPPHFLYVCKSCWAPRLVLLHSYCD